MTRVCAARNGTELGAERKKTLELDDVKRYTVIRVPPANTTRSREVRGLSSHSQTQYTVRVTRSQS
eukprot:3978460-Prymnesium_polylepis.2